MVEEAMPFEDQVLETAAAARGDVRDLMVQVMRVHGGHTPAQCALALHKVGAITAGEHDALIEQGFDYCAAEEACGAPIVADRPEELAKARVLDVLGNWLSHERAWGIDRATYARAVRYVGQMRSVAGLLKATGCARETARFAVRRVS